MPPARTLMTESHPITIVVAVSRNGVIGVTRAGASASSESQVGALPWRIRSDYKHFKALTRGGVIIMGRRTFESLAPEGSLGGLPDRLNIVVSSTLANVAAQNHLPEGGGRGWANTAAGHLSPTVPETAVCRSLADALTLARAHPRASRGVFVIGGESLFREALAKQMVNRVEITDVETPIVAPAGDSLTHFPGPPLWSHDPHERAALGWRLTRESHLPANPDAGDEHACWFRTYERV